MSDTQTDQALCIKAISDWPVGAPPDGVQHDGHGFTHEGYTTYLEVSHVAALCRDSGLRWLMRQDTYERDGHLRVLCEYGPWNGGEYRVTINGNREYYGHTMLQCIDSAIRSIHKP